MAEEIKTTPAPEGQTLEPPAPEVSEAPPAPEPGAQGVIPGMEGPPAPENKVINLSSVRGGGAGQEQTDPAKEGGQEWEKPQEQPEPPRRGRRPKNKEAPAQGEKPKRKGRPPKSEKQAPGGGGAGKTAKTPRQGKAASQPAPAKEEAPPPPAPEEQTQPKDASRGEKEEIVYLDLDQLHPFQNHPFGVRDDNEMKGLDLLTIRPPKVQRFQGFPDAKQGWGVSFPAPPLFWPHTVNILEEINMDKNQGYAILKVVMLENGRGFALGECPREPEPFVTWACYDDEHGRRQYEWGHYGMDRDALARDLTERVEDYQRQFSVKVAWVEEPGLYKYYSTQRPVDIGTFPKPSHNIPDEIVNYDQRVPVEGGAFLAWGHLTYTRPLSEKDMADYELRPSKDNPAVGKRMERKPSISQQMQEAGRQAQERQAPPTPKREAPDRGER